MSKLRAEEVVIWISCKERLPKGVSESYLVYRPTAPINKVCSLWFDPQYNGWSGKFKVTDWAFLPNKPIYSNQESKQ
jgi:hypothetical protein